MFPSSQFHSGFHLFLRTTTCTSPPCLRRSASMLTPSSFIYLNDHLMATSDFFSFVQVDTWKCKYGYKDWRSHTNYLLQFPQNHLFCWCSCHSCKTMSNSYQRNSAQQNSFCQVFLTYAGYLHTHLPRYFSYFLHTAILLYFDFLHFQSESQ